MGSLYDPAMLAQFLANFNATSCDATEDSAFFQVSPAAPVVVALIGVKFVGPSARAALQPFDCRYGIHAQLKHFGVMLVGTAHKDYQWDALSINDEMSLGA